MPIPPFSIGEIEPIRTKKLNELVGRIVDVEENGGGSMLQLDGGSATSSGTPSIVVDGGSA